MTSVEALQALGLGERATADEVKARYRKLAKQAHPDAGGDTASFQRLQVCYQLALKAAEDGSLRVCPDCNGAGKRLIQSGFFVVVFNCDCCGGRGHL